MGRSKDTDSVPLVVFPDDSNDHARNLQFPGGQDGSVLVVSRTEAGSPLMESVLPDDEIVVYDGQYDIFRYGSPSPLDDQLVSVDNPEVPHARSFHRVQYGNRRMLHDIVGKPQLPYPGFVRSGHFGHEPYIVIHTVKLAICT
jgi:hypothetical protein